jgi:hypothetical protein
MKQKEKYFETNKIGNAAYPNCLDSVKTVLRGKFIAINSYISNPTFVISFFLLSLYILF